MRRIALAILVLLTGCGESEVVKAQRFMAQCQGSGFEPKQCAFLYAMAKSAADDAQSANNLAGFAMGMSIGAASSAGSRR